MILTTLSFFLLGLFVRSIYERINRGIDLKRKMRLTRDELAHRAFLYYTRKNGGK